MQAMSKFQIHHVGIAVNNLDKAIEVYTSMGYSSSPVFSDPLQGVRICLLAKNDELMVELVARLNDIDRSPVDSILEKNGPTAYHTCYVVAKIEEAVNEMKELGFIQVSKLSPAIAFENRRVTFMYNSNVGLIELVEK
jgi:methylmalonyl-CoA/ethylmalonyl-CoA epimerase